MDLLDQNGKIKVMARFYELKQPGGESSQIIVLPKRNICVCCNVTDVPLIRLKICSHTSFIKVYFRIKINIAMALVCHYCHGVMKKIDDFKKQVEQSILLSKVPYASKAIGKLQRKKQKIISINPNELIYTENIQNVRIEGKKYGTKEPIIKSIKQEVDSKIDIELSEELIDTKYNVLCDTLMTRNNVLSGDTNDVSRHNFVELKNSGSRCDASRSKNNLSATAKITEILINPKHNEALNESRGDFEIEVPAWNINTDSSHEGDHKVLDGDRPNEDDTIVHDLPICQSVPLQVNTKPTPIDKFNGKIAIVFQTLEELQLEREAKARDAKYMKLKHKCEMCLVSYDHEDTLENHMKKHNKNIGDYICIVCHCVYATEAALKTHGECHFKRYQCMVCSLKFKNDNASIMHYNKTHGKDGDSLEILYECSKEDCDFTTPNHNEHMKHRRSHRKRPECGQCGKLISNIANLKRHIEAMHTKTNRVYKCKVCDKEYLSQAGFHLHCKSEHTDYNNPAFCTICKRQYKNRNILNSHLKRHSTHVADDQLRYICGDCGQKFAGKFQMRKHIEYQHLKIKHQCKECNQTFNFEKTLKAHMRVKHSSVPKAIDNILCQYCGKGFKQAKSLQSHIWSHTGERPLQCSRCPANFAHSAALYNHNRLVHKVPKLNKQEK